MGEKVPPSALRFDTEHGERSRDALLVSARDLIPAKASSSGEGLGRVGAYDVFTEEADLGAVGREPTSPRPQSSPFP